MLSQKPCLTHSWQCKREYEQNIESTCLAVLECCGPCAGMSLADTPPASSGSGWSSAINSSKEESRLRIFTTLGSCPCRGAGLEGNSARGGWPSGPSSVLKTSMPSLTLARLDHTRFNTIAVPLLSIMKKRTGQWNSASHHRQSQCIGALQTHL